MRNGSPEEGQFFYAVVRTEEPCDLGCIGLDGKRVHGIHYRDVAGLVSDYARVPAIKLLRKNLAPYHRVLWEAAARFTTIPARFGQIARDAAQVKLALRENYDRLRHELDRFDGTAELTLRIWWEVEDVFCHLVEQDAALRARRDRVLASRAGPSRSDAITLGCFAEERLNRARERLTAQILAALPAVEARLDELESDRMVGNLALLVHHGRRPELDRAVERLGDQLGDAHRLELTGPWPPYSFVDAVELGLTQG